MKPYLIRPRIQPDESLFGHLMRCAKANLVSPERMAHRIGLTHPHQMKPTYHTLLDFTQAELNYSTLLQIEHKTVSSKLLTESSFKGFDFKWHGLNLMQSQIRRSPRICPICLTIQPNIIREQWYLNSYLICGYHNFYMTPRPLEQSQSCIDFSTDVLSKLVFQLDSIFNECNQKNKLLRSTEELLNRLPIPPLINSNDKPNPTTQS